MTSSKLIGSIILLWFCLSFQTSLAQQMTDTTMGSTNATNERLIRAYYGAYETKDWSSMQPLLADNFTFSSPMDDHINVETYKGKCWVNAKNVKKFDIEELIVNGDDGFVTYNGWTLDGHLFRNTERFKFKGGKITENECFFGPGKNYPDNAKK